jgi:hypothetical protein
LLAFCLNVLWLALAYERAHSIDKQMSMHKLLDGAAPQDKVLLAERMERFDTNTTMDRVLILIHYTSAMLLQAASTGRVGWDGQIFSWSLAVP